MSRRSIVALHGLVRLVPDVDCIGVPVFRQHGMNYDLVAETDADLKITKFLELYPDQGYQIEALPCGSEMRKRHSIGDPSPIPFIVDGNINLIMGDRHPSDLDNFSARSLCASQVIDDLKGLLARARGGFFRQRTELWQSDEVRAGFPELFEERPSNSRYWVTRYRVAITHSKKAGAFTPAMADEFRSRGNQWLELFGTKTEFSRMRLLFEKADEGVFSRDDVVASAFGFFCHKLATQQFQVLERTARQDAYFLGLFPHGLYYYQAEHGFPPTPFPYDRPSNLLEELKARLHQASDTFRLSKAKDLALVLFGMKDSPNEFQDDLARLRDQFTSNFRASKRAIEFEFGLGRDAEFLHFRAGWEPNDRRMLMAFSLVRAYDALVDLEGVEYGDARLTPRKSDYLADDKELVDEVRSIFQKG